MRSLDFSRYVLGSCAVAAMLAGCGALPLSQRALSGVEGKGQDDMQPPIGAPGAMPQASAIAAHADHGKSWASPNAKRSNLLYVSDMGTDEVSFLSYPAGTLQGKITDFGGAAPAGMCVDAKQDVWIALGNVSAIVEYAHGGTSAIRYLTASSETIPNCSIDPTTGNLAATSTTTGHVLVFPDAQGAATVYTDPELSRSWACGYDDNGNLFVDGWDSSGHFVFAELPKGSGSLTNINLNIPYAVPGGIQWDGRYVDVGEVTSALIYQTTGAGGKIVNTISIDTGSSIYQFWRKRSTVIVALSSQYVGFYPYPAGGNPKKSLSGFETPFGAVISKALRK